VAIPKISSETSPPISPDQIQSGNVMFTSHESESQVVHQHSFLPNPQSFMWNSQLENEGEMMTSEEPFTTSMTESSWISENEEYDIKYEIRSESGVTIEPFQSDLDHLNLSQQNDYFVLICTQSEVDDVPDVVKFLDAQQTTTTTQELDLPSHNIFICGTCGHGFVSYRQLRIHDRMHLRGGSGKSRVKTIRRKKGKSHDNTNNVKPSLRPKECEECGKVLSTHFMWRYHVMSVHRGQYRFKCTLCNYGSQKPCRLRQHIKNVHSVNNENLKCSKCDRVFESKRGHSCHMFRCSVVQ